MPSAVEVLSAIQGAAGAIAGNAAAVDSDRKFPEQSLGALAEAGAFGFSVAPDQGGCGASLSQLAQACEAVGQACSSTGMVFLMHCVTAATMGAGGGERCAAALEEMADRDALGTLAFSERASGAHFYAPELKATRNGDGSVHVTGTKSFCTSAGYADYLLVLVQSAIEGADAYLMPRDAPGVSYSGQWHGLGMSGNSSVSVNFDNVAFTPDDLVGAPGKAGDLIFGVVAPFFLVGLSAVNVGIAQAAASAAVEHVKSRSYSDGSTLAEIQYIQHLVADMDLATRQARLLVHNAAALGDSGDPGALVPIMEAKVASTEAAQVVTEKALSACGGQGYTPSLPVERHLRDARAGAVMAPTNAVLRNWIGKALTGLPVP
ncbi:MAG: acyl-CoA dehydrogenase family protein [Actinomycetota bacterium]